ncbi:MULTISPECIES: zinc dependent phospholipase C family protein [Virgibacillus]|uniref:Phospholipase C/D domain-containing protein n=1 Tax=Virgibacillus massiliensis TaxID=1462526 RepID=A0A024QEQ5_9BACI|nr:MULTISPECIES: zinc dependent phospholipase C family protein [Virgibacillus]EQB35100.1 hypothetical protein M948_18555 [Virgibacillus sp. CM-4]MYL42842.1 hypothetical protein [Virgibacillus massiliensis]CDQ40737.1 hypothetical protein BN990_03064 [Virgibacillus massiliensis]
MPNIWTHILFCEEIVDEITQTKTISNHETIMKLGAQGPDPFFYYKFWPWLKDESVQKVGTALHTRYCGDFLIDLIKAASTLNGSVKAYVFGFITHHILDRNTHPYIHYRAGYEGSKHQKLEVFIDTLMMEKYQNLKTWKTPVYKEIDVGISIDEDIRHLLHRLVTKYFPEFNFSTTRYIQKSYRDMKFALKLLADPYGWKNALLKSTIASYSHQPIRDEKDYLNLHNTTWFHPATNKPCTHSFLDLYHQAKVEAIEILTTVNEYWNSSNESLLTKLTGQIGNISYDTGKSLHLELENRYSEPIV